MSNMMEAFYEWVSPKHRRGSQDFRRYVHGIAQARYVVRRIFRIVDEQAKSVGLEPLQHQALLQIYGTSGEPLRINDVAERLDIAPAFASRLIRELERRGLVGRQRSQQDRRIIYVTATPQGQALLAQIDENVHLHVDYFQKRLSRSERAAALGVFAFYVGASLHEDDLAELAELVRSEP